MENSELYYTEPHQVHVWKKGEARPVFSADTYYSAKLAASELNRLSRPVTDAEIDAMFPIDKNDNIGQITQQYAKREGAKALRDKLEGKG